MHGPQDCAPKSFKAQLGPVMKYCLDQEEAGMFCAHTKNIIE